MAEKEKKKTEGEKYQEEAKQEIEQDFSPDIDEAKIEALSKQFEGLNELEKQKLLAVTTNKFQEARKFRVESQKIWYDKVYIVSRNLARDLQADVRGNKTTPMEAFNKYKEKVTEYFVAAQKEFDALAKAEADEAAAKQ